MMMKICLDIIRFEIGALFETEKKIEKKKIKDFSSIFFCFQKVLGLQI